MLRKTAFPPIIVLIVLRNVLSRFSVFFCSHSQKPLMVIHHQVDCQFSQGTAATLVYNR